MDQRGGISLIYVALMSKTEKPSYARAWEEDLNNSWSTAVWYRASTRAYKGIMNVGLIEASLKLLVRWYYVPSRLARMFPGTSPQCFRGCELGGTMYHTWWSCPRIRAFWKKVFWATGALLGTVISPQPNVALLNQCIPGLPKLSQSLAFFILLGAKMTIAKAWKKPSVSFLAFKRKVSWIMSQEQIVAKCADQSEKFRSVWEPWATYCEMSLLPGIQPGGGSTPLHT